MYIFYYALNSVFNQISMELNSIQSIYLVNSEKKAIYRFKENLAC